MLEILMAVAVFLLAVLGLGLGLAMGRPPLKTSCERAGDVPHARCADCPLRRQKAAEAAS